MEFNLFSFAIGATVGSLSMGSLMFQMWRGPRHYTTKSMSWTYEPKTHIGTLVINEMEPTRWRPVAVDPVKTYGAPSW